MTKGKLFQEIFSFLVICIQESPGLGSKGRRTNPERAAFSTWQQFSWRVFCDESATGREFECSAAMDLGRST